MGDHHSLIERSIQQSIDVKTALLSDASLIDSIDQVASRCIDCLEQGGKLLFAGNGGSAADAQHLAAEIVCRFNFDRPAAAAIALGTNFSVMTAGSNDYGYEFVFARELEALGRQGDVFIGLSTSGNSANILQAIETAGKLGITTVGLAGQGGALKQSADFCISVPASHTPRIQESHILIGHILCEIIENQLFAGK